VKFRWLILVLMGGTLAALVQSGSGSSEHPAPRGGTMKLHSPAIPPGGTIPRRFTCDGEDVSPPLGWEELPAGTRSLSLIADDPDAPGGTFVHWVLYDLPATLRELPEAVPASAELPSGARHGRNDFGTLGYRGPCPPRGNPHRYYFRLFALDRPTGLAAGASRAQLERAMQGHILGQAELMGRYGRGSR
jgi:Raf kinase inhibitor-like YbhB/YbcL family protein